MADVVLRDAGKGRYEFTVDGYDLANVTTGIELVAGHVAPPRFVVTMATTGLDIGVEADVEVDQALASALIALGWVPPAR